MLFTTKIFLYGLIGLLLPILLHLWNKQKPKVIPYGSIELMEDLESNRSNRLNISDWLLLALRLLIIGLLVFLLMQPYFLESKNIEPLKQYEHIVLVDPILQKEKAIQESIEKMERPIFLLCENLPSIGLLGKNIACSNTQQTSYWDILSQVDFADTVTVFGTNEINKFEGKKTAFPFVINWKNIDPKASSEKLIKVSQLGEKEYQLRILESTEEGNRVKTIISNLEEGLIQLKENQIIYKKKDTLSVSPLDTLKIAYKHDAKTKEAWQLIEAALKSIENHSKIPIVFNSEQTDCFFCLGEDDCSGGKLNLFYTNGKNQKQNVKVPQIIELDSPNNFNLLGDLRRSNPQIKNLPLILSQFFETKVFMADERESLIDNRKIPANLLETKKTLKTPKIAEAKVIQEKDRMHFPIWLILLGFVLLERLVVVFRR